MDRQQIARCLEQVAAFRASGLTAKAWSEANGVPMRSIASWCAHSRRWQAKLDGVEFSPSAPLQSSSGFVAARVAPYVAPSPAAPASVRVELNAGPARFELHWPLTHMHELAALLRELGR